MAEDLPDRGVLGLSGTRIYMRIVTVMEEFGRLFIRFTSAFNSSLSYPQQTLFNSQIIYHGTDICHIVFKFSVISLVWMKTDVYLDIALQP